MGIENTVNLSMGKGQYKKLQIISGSKVILKNLSADVNKESFDAKEIKTRGNNSLNYRRKSYSISLTNKAKFFRNTQAHDMKKFYAVNLSMDKNYIRNRLAYGMMEKIGIYYLYYGFANLSINENNEGIYMIIERPQDWAMKTKGSPLVIRRGYDHKIDKIKTGEKLEKKDEKRFVGQYRKIYKSLNRYEGKVLYDSLSNWLDMELYMKWLAFNYFVRNGDYTDEVYFCIDPNSSTFKFIPWDYDDIFAIQPHEGIESRKKDMGSRLLYSSEDELDKKIGSDTYLYQKYLQVLESVLVSLDDKSLKDIFESTYAELFPYLMSKEIVSMSEFDLYKKVSEESVAGELNILYGQLSVARSNTLKLLND
jgi:spore coat protein H